MSSNLETFRDHARRMAQWTEIPDAERVLWQRLADEVDDYLQDDRDEAMF